MQVFHTIHHLVFQVAVPKKATMTQTVEQLLGDNTALIETVRALKDGAELLKFSAGTSIPVSTAIRKAMKNNNNEDLSHLYLQVAVCNTRV